MTQEAPVSRFTSHSNFPFKLAAANYRVWLLFITYGACFGIEIFIHNIAAIYYVDHFQLSLESAGELMFTPAS